MNNARCFCAPLALALLFLTGCDRSAGPASLQKYQVLDTRTDQFDTARARSQAEDAIARYPDLAGMVGLFAYNPPKCLEAVKAANKVGEIQVIGFDEADETLQGIEDGSIYGTVVQNPYRYGYESVRILAGLARGDESVLPEDGFLNIKARAITKENVKDFREELDGLMAENKEATGAKKKDAKEDETPTADGDKPTVAYVTNGIASFWVIAAKGAQDAAEEFDVHLEVRMPPKGTADQKQMVQDLLTLGVDGIAISPIDPDNQMDLLDEIAEKTILVTQDSDAPQSERVCYVGMDNYVAGRMCGRLVKEALPEGGQVMLFVGRLEQANARLRQQGVIDELHGRQRKGASGEQESRSESKAETQPDDDGSGGFGY